MGTDPSPAGPTPKPPARKTLRDLWSKMGGIYGSRWASAYGEAPEHLADGPHHQAGELTDAGTVWQQGLTGLTPRQLAQGLHRAVMSAEPWPPTLPEFRAQCLGIPTLSQVQLLLARPREQSPEVAAFCRLVWRFIGDEYRMARAGREEAARLVRDAYMLAREYRMNLGELPEAPRALLQQQKPERPTRASQDVEDEYMRNLAQMLRMDIDTDTRELRDRDEPEEPAAEDQP